MCDTELTGRLTCKKLVAWVNCKFDELEIDNYKVVEIYRTHFTQDQYEGGACYLTVKFENISMPEDDFLKYGYFSCYYPIWLYQEYLNNGYELYLKDTQRHNLLTNFTIEVRKK